MFTLNIRQGDRTATYDVLIALVTEEIPTIHTDEIETYFVDASEPLLLKVGVFVVETMTFLLSVFLKKQPDPFFFIFFLFFYFF